MNNILFCIYHEEENYYYGDYLLNCIASVKFFCGDVDIVILGEEANVVGNRNLPFLQKESGKAANLFLQLDMVRDYAILEGFKFLYILPSRVQFFKSPTFFWDEATSLLKKDTSISMISTVYPMDKMLPTYPYQHKWKKSNSEGFIESEVCGFCQTGLISLDFLDEYPFRFGNSNWRSLNSWWVQNKCKVAFSNSAYSGWIPWISNLDDQLDLKVKEGEFFLELKENVCPSNTNWESDIAIRGVGISNKNRYWKSPEQYWNERLQTDARLIFFRRFIKKVIPRKFRYFLYMLCEN